MQIKRKIIICSFSRLVVLSAFALFARVQILTAQYDSCDLQ